MGEGPGTEQSVALWFAHLALYITYGQKVRAAVDLVLAACGPRGRAAAPALGVVLSCVCRSPPRRERVRGNGKVLIYYQFMIHGDLPRTLVAAGLISTWARHISQTDG